MSSIELNHSWAQIQQTFSSGKSSANHTSKLLKNRIQHLLEQHWQMDHGHHVHKHIVDHVFNQLLENNNIGKSALKSQDEAKRIFDQINPDLFDAIAPQDRGIPLDIQPSRGNTLIAASNVLKLLMGANFHRHALSWPLIKAIFVRKDPKMSEGLETAITSAIETIYNQLTQPDLTPNQEKLARYFIGNLLSIYTFVEPQKPTIRVPQKIENRWEMVEYKIEILPLTPQWLGDPIPAYGLTPLNQDKASPLLLFRGTPHPTANGLIPAVSSDFVPGYAVGEVIYEYSCKKLVEDWIDKANSKYGKVSLYGQSLGGSLSLLTLSRQPQKIKEVFAYGSPAPLGNTLKLYEKNCHEHKCERPKVHLLWNQNDPVPIIGSGFHPDWDLLKVIITGKQNRLEAHASINVGMPKAVVMKMNNKVVNQAYSRLFLNILHQAISLLCLPGSLLYIGLRYLAFHLIKICQGIILKIKQIANKIF